jgi:hypothetical protein
MLRTVSKKFFAASAERRGIINLEKLKQKVFILNFT